MKLIKFLKSETPTPIWASLAMVICVLSLSVQNDTAKSVLNIIGYAMILTVFVDWIVGKLKKSKPEKKDQKQRFVITENGIEIHRPKIILDKMPYKVSIVHKSGLIVANIVKPETQCVIGLINEETSKIECIGESLEGDIKAMSIEESEAGFIGAYANKDGIFLGEADCELECRDNELWVKLVGYEVHD